MLSVGVCEDDPAIRRVLQRSLEYAEHRAVIAHTGAEALRLFLTAPLDVIVMDIGLPDADGRDVVHALKTSGQFAPVLFLTALGAVHDRLSGFAVGAEDYVAKPFSYGELRLRVAAVLRRTRERRQLGRIRVGTLEVDPGARTVTVAGARVAVSAKEFALLKVLAAEPTRVFAKEVAGFAQGREMPAKAAIPRGR